MDVVYRTDLDKDVVVTNCERRGWQRWDPSLYAEEEYNVYWASVGTVRHLFSADRPYRLGDHQRINHFPNHFELTRKDLLVKNLRRYRKETERLLPAGALDFLPTAYTLPADMALFVEEFKRTRTAEAGAASWILKPACRSQGRGIFIVRSLAAIKRWAAQQFPGGLRGSADTYVVSRYIDRPLLVGGRKFDIRLYVLVTSYRPLRAWVSDAAFCRFCTEPYGTGDLSNAYVHLTNVAVQKHAEGYNAKHGGKWPLAALLAHVEGTRGAAAAAALLEGTRSVVLHSLRAVQHVMVNDRHCFELLGYDMLLDEALRPWLLEVNASPSLTCTTDADRTLKQAVIAEALALAVPDDFLVVRPRDAPPPPAVRQLGSFRLLVDEFYASGIAA